MPRAISHDSPFHLLLAATAAAILLATPSARAQTSFSGQMVISTAADNASAVFAADVDGDGDTDALSASFNDDKIAWYENTSGDGTAWTPHTIATSADGARGVFAADIDGDLDLDVVSASSNDNEIAWYENTAGDGSAWTAMVISSSALAARSVHAADVDGDDDVDVLSASENDDKVAWYENTAGDGSAWTERVISTIANSALSVYVDGVDGDGDVDVLSAAFFDDTIAWYDNTAGNGTAWTRRVISTAADGAFSVFAADVDGDGDADALSASSNDDEVNWYENTTGGGTAWTLHTIATTADSARSVYAADLDNDDDLDALSASSNDDEIAWYENTAGDGSAWTTHTISTLADAGRSVYAADVDGDGDLDVLSASANDDKIAWYRNDLVTIPTLGEWGAGLLAVLLIGAGGRAIRAGRRVRS